MIEVTHRDNQVFVYWNGECLGSRRSNEVDHFAAVRRSEYVQAPMPTLRQEAKNDGSAPNHIGEAWWWPQGDGLRVELYQRTPGGGVSRTDGFAREGETVKATP